MGRHALYAIFAVTLFRVLWTHMSRVAVAQHRCMRGVGGIFAGVKAH